MSNFSFKPHKTLLLLSLLPASVWAQDAEQTVNVQEITVTGTNRVLQTENRDSYTASALRSTTGLVLRPKEIPQSVSMITKDQIADQGITDLAGALRTTTGVNVIETGGRTHFISRGYFIEQFEEDGIATQIGSPGGFGLGGPQGDPVSFTDLAIYDHVEVVRGAAGLTQANNEPGGTVNAVRKKPTSQTQLSADLSVDRWGKAAGIFDASGTLSRDAGLRGRFVGSLGSNRTFQDRSGGRDLLLYGVMDKTIGDNGKLTWGANYTSQNSVPDPDGLPLKSDGSGLPRDMYLGADWNTRRLKKTNLFTEFEYYLNDDWKFDSKLDWRKSSSHQEYYTLGASGSGIGSDGIGQKSSFDRYKTDSRQWSWQNNLKGKFDAFGRSHDVFLTHLYSQEKNSSYNHWPEDNSRHSIYTFNGSGIAKPDWDAASNSARGGEGHYKTHALSAGLRFNPTDRLHLLAGGRYTRWYRYLHWDRNLKDSASGTVYELKRNRFVPYAGLTYDITPDQSIYAGYSAIFKQTMNRDQNDNLLPPIMGRNYEIGWKGEWYKGRLNAAVALYHTDKDNNNQRVNVPGSQAYWVSLDQRSKGVDAEISGNLTDNWKLFAGYTFNRSTNRNSVPGNIAARQKGYNFSSYTPKHMLRLYTSYRLPVDNGKWTVGLGLAAQSETHGNNGLKQGGYTVWNTNLQYRPTKATQLSLAVNNLTDKRYYASQYGRSYSGNNFYGEPRNIVFGFKWKM